MTDADINLARQLSITTQPTSTGHSIGIITLTDPKTLNSLSTYMCERIVEQLSVWQEDDALVAVVLRGDGERAFCAGGNIKNLYNSMIQGVYDIPADNTRAADFFISEYITHMSMHRFTKPIVVWASGIVMGGGMGLLNASSHRIVTESTRFAMPEINIGLFPDACGSWFLQRMPAKSGLFFGLTGSQGNANDALVANMADYVLAADEFNVLLDTLCAINWEHTYQDGVHHGNTHNNNTHNNNEHQRNLHNLVSQALATIDHREHISDNAALQSNLLKHWNIIQKMSNQGSITDIDCMLTDTTLHDAYTDDVWMSTAFDTYQRGCPATAAISFEAFKRAKTMSVEQVLCMELNIALHCVHYPDFREGVRALLVDKDKCPQWSRTLSECHDSFVNAHFANVYTDSHPFEGVMDSNYLDEFINRS